MRFLLIIIMLILSSIISCNSCRVKKYFPEIINNPRCYSTFINQLYEQKSEIILHFPKTLKKEQKILGFSYLPGFLQGGAHIQLRLKVSEEDLNKLYEKYNKIKTKSFYGGTSSEHINRRDGMPTTSFYTNNNTETTKNLTFAEEIEKLTFPEDYEIMIFDEIIRKEESSGGFWNHGKSHGVVISKKRNEIIYFAQSW